MIKQIPNNSKKTLTTNSQIISQTASPNTPRTFVCITNTSTAGEIVYVSDGQAAESGAGVPLSPGGVYQDAIIGTGNDPIYPSQEALYALASAATATIAIMEKVQGVN